jgi:hypothetical protein
VCCFLKEKEEGETSSLMVCMASPKRTQLQVQATPDSRSFKNNSLLFKRSRKFGTVTMAGITADRRLSPMDPKEELNTKVEN